MERNFIVRKNGIFLKDFSLDILKVYKIQNISNNRWFIRNGHIFRASVIKEGKKVDVSKILAITVPKFETPYFNVNDIVRVTECGRIDDKRTIQLSKTSTD